MGFSVMRFQVGASKKEAMGFNIRNEVYLLIGEVGFLPRAQ